MSPDRAKLTLKDEQGAPLVLDPATNTLVLLTEHTYIIPAPPLEPKEKM